MFSFLIGSHIQAQLRQNLQPTASNRFNRLSHVIQGDNIQNPALGSCRFSSCGRTRAAWLLSYFGGGSWRWLRMGLLILDTMIFPIFFPFDHQDHQDFPFFPLFPHPFRKHLWFSQHFTSFYHHPSFLPWISTGTTNNEAKCGPNGPSCNVWWRPPRPALKHQMMRIVGFQMF